MTCLTTNEIEQLVERHDVVGLDALAERNGMTEARKAMTWSALWHNMQQPQFARIAITVWGCQVAVLPDMRVYKLAQQMAKKAKGKIAISVSVAATPAGETVYMVGQVSVTCG